ncbi:LuxR C-terminal-related transcriptional regulator [Streptomyces sp. enrichment culture]|uniref:LuxR C-terminal-related transcriptional regulator n=1 Tax=Streptomyces sp. enrichment culture TaxID=1795815 RepID=UPI003F57F852
MLSPRERLALRGIARGRTSMQTAIAMRVTDSQVTAHLGSAGGKLGTRERAAMVHRAYIRRQLDAPAFLDSSVVGLLMPDDQRTVLVGLAGGATVEEIAAVEGLPVSEVRKSARCMVLALGAASAPHAVTRGWQYRLLGTPALPNTFTVRAGRV